MVQRKQVRKKPKDSVDFSRNGLPKNHVRGGGDPRSRGGGVAMAGTALPNYMRATSSSGAKAGAAVGREEAPAVPPKLKPVRAKVVFTKNPYVSRATCSSTMKGSGFPAAVDLAPCSSGGDGPAAGHVCPYAYCSLNGHVHASVVPLRSFMASQRRLIKTQQSMKLMGVSPFRKTNNGGGGGGAGDGFFVEIYAGATATATAPTVSSDLSDLSTEEMDAMIRRMESVMFDHRSCGNAGDNVKDLDVSVDGSCGSSDVISDGLAELLGTTKSPGCKKEIAEEKATSVDQEAEDFGACKSDISEELDAKDGENISEDNGGDDSKEFSIDDISSAFGGMNFTDAVSDAIDAATCQRNKVATARRTPEEGEQMRPFNRRAPNFLPVKPDPDAEKVYLRHQMMDDRKNAEEWMVDYALRRAVKKLARGQKRKVEMLVQAFESALPPVTNEDKSVQHDDDKESFTHTRPWQACS